MKIDKYIAFDIDDTLLIPSIVSDTGKNEINQSILHILKKYKEQGYKIIVWSGSGVLYSKYICKKYNIPYDYNFVKSGDLKNFIDVCYDDCDVNLAIKNIKVPTIKKQISRKEWNKKNWLIEELKDKNNKVELNNKTELNKHLKKKLINHIQLLNK